MHIPEQLRIENVSDRHGISNTSPSIHTASRRRYPGAMASLVTLLDCAP
jgi:hypothetical protein